MLSLLITNNSVSNPQTLDLSPFVDVQDGSGLDIANPAFTNRVYSRSLLKEGASLALTQYVEKQLVFPLLIGPVGGYSQSPTTFGQMATLIEQVNQLLDTPGAVVTWKADQASQPTFFDVIAGQFEVAYSYRKEQQDWTAGNLRVFCQPFGRTAGPRPFASASAVGPLLMISPYASGGALAIGASTQAGVAGFGGRQQGASSGIFYSGSPSLAGDAPALLQVSYVGPLPTGATQAGIVPYAAVSVLPDANYQPLTTLHSFGASAGRQAADAVASTYYTSVSGNQADLWLPVPSAPVPQSWAGPHRFLAIARASGTANTLATRVSPVIPNPTTATVYPGSWQLCDLGTISFRASEPPAYVQLAFGWQNAFAAGQAGDVTAVIMLPDAATWFLNPAPLGAPPYSGIPSGPNFAWSSGEWTNTLVLDDLLADQFVYGWQGGGIQPFAPNPTGLPLYGSGRITQYSRGLVPRPDPKNGLPILAILGVGQFFTPSLYGATPSATWANPQNLPTNARVSIQDRARYVLP